MNRVLLRQLMVGTLATSVILETGILPTFVHANLSAWNNCSMTMSRCLS